MLFYFDVAMVMSSCLDQFDIINPKLQSIDRIRAERKQCVFPRTSKSDYTSGLIDMSDSCNLLFVDEAGSSSQTMAGVKQPGDCVKGKTINDA